MRNGVRNDSIWMILMIRALVRVCVRRRLRCRMAQCEWCCVCASGNCSTELPPVKAFPPLLQALSTPRKRYFSSSWWKHFIDHRRRKKSCVMIMTTRRREKKIQATTTMNEFWGVICGFNVLPHIRTVHCEYVPADGFLACASSQNTHRNALQPQWNAQLRTVWGSFARRADKRTTSDNIQWMWPYGTTDGPKVMELQYDAAWKCHTPHLSSLLTESTYISHRHRQRIRCPCTHTHIRARCVSAATAHLSCMPMPMFNFAHRPNATIRSSKPSCITVAQCTPLTWNFKLINFRTDGRARKK